MAHRGLHASSTITDLQDAVSVDANLLAPTGAEKHAGVGCMRLQHFEPVKAEGASVTLVLEHPTQTEEAGEKSHHELQGNEPLADGAICFGGLQQDGR